MCSIVCVACVVYTAFFFFFFFCKHVLRIGEKGYEISFLAKMDGIGNSICLVCLVSSRVFPNHTNFQIGGVFMFFGKAS